MGRALRLSILLSLPLPLSACAPEGPTAFVTFNRLPNSECVWQPAQGGDEFLPTGLYDINVGDGAAKPCLKPYTVHLQVNSFLRSNSDQALGRAEPNILQLHSAEVTLMDLQRRLILFDRFDEILPNPFLVTVGNSIFTSDGQSPGIGIAAVEVIPVAYAPQLDQFAEQDQQVLAEIQIFGTTTGDVDVDFQPFSYPIDICNGCLTISESELEARNISRDDLVGNNCDDNAGAEGRWCIWDDRGL